VRTIVRRAGHARGQNSWPNSASFLEEADEAAFWLDLLRDAGVFPAQKVRELTREANQLVSIFVASMRTAKGFTSAI
jgi:hypothetical protein